MKKKRKKPNDELDEEVSPQLEFNFDDPNTKIDFTQLDSLCVMQCTSAEIRGVLNCSEETLNTQITAAFGISFSEYHKRKKAVGQVKLRRLQWAAATGRLSSEKFTGNWNALRWLGVQYLGQREMKDTPGGDDISKKYADLLDLEII
jgi:hypothetical protein